MDKETPAPGQFPPAYRNLVDLLQNAIAQHAERPLFGVRQPAGWQWLTYREFGALVVAFRGGLSGLGVRAGDRVAVISNNRIEWAVGAYAVYTLGACYVPMYEAQLDRDWQFILSDSGAKVCLVANSVIAQRLEQLRPTLPALESLITLDGSESDPNSYAALLACGRQQPVAAVVPEERTLASLIYTSGTTGRPKGVMLSHLNLASNACGSVGIVDIDENDRGVSFLPWAHVFGGCIELNGALAVGSSFAICSEASRLVEYLAEVRPTVLFGVPRVWNRIYNAVQANMASMPRVIRKLYAVSMLARDKQRRGKRLGLIETVSLRLARKLIFPKILAKFGGRLRCVYSGAAKISGEVAHFFENLGIELYEGYGMTETSGTITTTPSGRAWTGSVGVPSRGVSIRIDENVSGVSPGEGEILIYGDGVMQGYWNQVELTRNAITPDGGLRSGDVGRVDAEGYLYVTGRIKEMYKLENGKYVAPAPLEEALLRSPFIAECVVFGADKPFNVALIFPALPALKAWMSEAGCAVEAAELLATHPTALSLFEAEIAKYSSDFKPYERIAKFALELGELSIESGLLTPTLKVKRGQVVAKYRGALESLYVASESSTQSAGASYVRELAPGKDARNSRTG